MELHPDNKAILDGLLDVAKGIAPANIGDLVRDGYATNPPPMLTKKGARELVVLLQWLYDLEEKNENDPKPSSGHDHSK